MWLGVVTVLAVVLAAVAVAAVTRGGETAKPKTPSVGSQRFGDDADLMRRLERKKLVRQQR
jgi:hypothetical protein